MRRFNISIVISMLVLLVFAVSCQMEPWIRPEKVSDADSLLSSLEKGGRIILTDNIEVDVTKARATSALTISSNVKLDLGGKTLSYKTANRFMDIRDGNVEITNGRIIVRQEPQDNHLSTIEVGSYYHYDYTRQELVEHNGTLILNGVTFESNSAGIIAGGKSKIIIKNSEILASGYALCSSLLYGEDFDISIINSTLVADTNDYDNVGIILNGVNGNLSVNNSLIKGARQVVVVRGGSAEFKDVTLVKTDNNNKSDYDHNNGENWGAGNSVPQGVIVIGDKGFNMRYSAKSNVAFSGRNSFVVSSGYSGNEIYILGNKNGVVLDTGGTLQGKKVSIGGTLIEGEDYYVTIDGKTIESSDAITLE